MEFLQSNTFIFVFPDKDKWSLQRPYPTLAQYITDAGAEVFFIDIHWDKHKSLAACSFEATKKIQELINEFNPPQTYFVGVGVGAMIAAHIGFMFRAKKMLLCSMKPFFQDELALLPWGWRYHAKRKIYAGAPKPNYPANRIEIPTIFIQGEKEKHYLNEKLMALRQETFVNSELVIIPKSGAKITRKAYLAAFETALQKMLGAEKTTPSI
jgi:hypothetical protein